MRRNSIWISIGLWVGLYLCWITLFRDHDLAIDDLFELRAPKRATSTYGDYVDHDWARRWPAEEIWRVRKL